MNNLTGLRSKVYGQGIHFKIPVIEVTSSSTRNLSYTTPGLNLSIST
jgi:hypothetical protein